MTFVFIFDSGKGGTSDRIIDGKGIASCEAFSMGETVLAVLCLCRSQWFPTGIAKRLSDESD
jgi:hypothetical protein